MADIQISSTKKYVLIIGLIVALVAAAAIFIGTRSNDENNEDNKGDNAVSETDKPETEKVESTKTGTVDLVIERVSPQDFVKPAEQDPNSPTPVTEWGAFVSNGEITWRSMGSSTCPPIILSATYDYDSNVVSLTQANYAGRVCTMDLIPVRQIITLPESGEIPEDAEIHIAKEL